MPQTGGPQPCAYKASLPVLRLSAGTVKTFSLSGRDFWHQADTTTEKRTQWKPESGKLGAFLFFHRCGACCQDRRAACLLTGGDSALPLRGTGLFFVCGRRLWRGMQPCTALGPAGGFLWCVFQGNTKQRFRDKPVILIGVFQPAAVFFGCLANVFYPHSMDAGVWLSGGEVSFRGEGASGERIGYAKQQKALLLKNLHRDNAALFQRHAAARFQGVFHLVAQYGA